MQDIDENTSLNDILSRLSKLREQKGNEEKTLHLINKALSHGHGFVVSLMWEEALTYQHLVMNEDAKGENADQNIRNRNLSKMRDVVGIAKYYIVRSDLTEWKSRLYRFVGRVNDYSGEYGEAVKNYRRSIKHLKSDPDYLRNKTPYNLEINGFLGFSLIMTGREKAGYKLAVSTYEQFETDKRAVELKKRDYATWAIWKSGIAVRTIKALVLTKSLLGKADLKDWLVEAEKLLKPNENFSYRLDEIKFLKKYLLKN